MPIWLLHLLSLVLSPTMALVELFLISVCMTSIPVTGLWWHRLLILNLTFHSRYQNLTLSISPLSLSHPKNSFTLLWYDGISFPLKLWRTEFPFPPPSRPTPKSIVTDNSLPKLTIKHRRNAVHCMHFPLKPTINRSHRIFNLKSLCDFDPTPATSRRVSFLLLFRVRPRTAAGICRSSSQWGPERVTPQPIIASSSTSNNFYKLNGLSVSCAELCSLVRIFIYRFEGLPPPQMHARSQPEIWSRLHGQFLFSFPDWASSMRWNTIIVVAP